MVLQAVKKHCYLIVALEPVAHAVEWTGNSSFGDPAVKGAALLAGLRFKPLDNSDGILHCLGDDLATRLQIRFGIVVQGGYLGGVERVAVFYRDDAYAGGGCLEGEAIRLRRLFCFPERLLPLFIEGFGNRRSLFLVAVALERGLQVFFENVSV